MTHNISVHIFYYSETECGTGNNPMLAALNEVLASAMRTLFQDTCLIDMDYNTIYWRTSAFRRFFTFIQCFAGASRNPKPDWIRLERRGDLCHEPTLAEGSTPLKVKWYKSPRGRVYHMSEGCCGAYEQHLGEPFLRPCMRCTPQFIAKLQRNDVWKK